jgi:uncharacterized SAM-binding protein YcdF (DUF218 family)
VSVESDALLIWDFHHLDHVLAPAECIVVLGSHDLRVAERAAEVYAQGWAPLVVFSGGLGSLTSRRWSRPEAVLFAEVAEARGVPRERILIEDRATNTGDNVTFSRALLEGRGIHLQRAIAIQKPYMERRTYATFRQLWPELEVRVTSPRIGFEDYITPDITRDDVINIMVGDLQRLMVYAKRGFSIPQEIPSEVRAAFERLVAAGYTHRLIEA